MLVRNMQQYPEQTLMYLLRSLADWSLLHHLLSESCAEGNISLYDVMLLSEARALAAIACMADS
jgi:hypothetical protein